MSKESIDSIQKKIKGSNFNRRIKIRIKKTGRKGYHVYFDLWNQGKREYEYLNIFLEGKNALSQTDKEKLRVVQLLRDEREKELVEKRTGFKLIDSKSQEDFIDYFSNLVAKKNHHNWRSCLKHLKDFEKKSLPISSIDLKFCEDFKNYLLSKTRENTTKSYFAKLKAALNKAKTDGIISENPSTKIKLKGEDTTREFLTFEEIEKLIHTPVFDIEIKNAFIFSCFTGLRISDIRNLEFKNIQNGYLLFRQKKTSGIVRQKLHPNAQTIIEMQRDLRKNSENYKIFLLPLTADTINKVVRNWVKDAKINRHITFHCARHSFATMGLTYGADLYTISKLLGHSDISITQVYARIIDTKKDAAIDCIPIIEEIKPE